MNTLLLDSYTADRVSKSLPSGDSLLDLAEFFSALSDVTRLKILCALSVSSMCVSDLSALTGINQTTVSHQLRILRGERIVSASRQGKVIFYSLEEKELPKLMNIAVCAVLS